MDDLLLTNVDERGIATVTLNRPDVHNAFNGAVVTGLAQAFSTFGGEAGVRAIVLTGAGKSFSAGGDLNWMKQAATFTEQENRDDALALSNMLAVLDKCPKPTIAAVNGTAMGGGVGLVACCDIVLAVPHAKFALSEVRLGLTPATISPYVVAKIGLGQARRLFLTGERFTAAEACQIGLVHQVVEDLDMSMDSIIDAVLAGAPGAQADAKDLAFSVAGREIDTALRADTAGRIAARRVSAEGQEGLSAFLDKRPPNWRPA